VSDHTGTCIRCKRHRELLALLPSGAVCGECLTERDMRSVEPIAPPLGLAGSEEDERTAGAPTDAEGDEHG
jgi:hypothetical protein